MGQFRMSAFFAAASMTTMALGQTATQASTPAPYTIQARVVAKKGVEVTRGLTVEVASDATGHRYFYSEAVAAKLGTWTSIESWTQQDGKPVLAVYRYGTGGREVGRIRFEFGEKTVTIKSARSDHAQIIDMASDQQFVLSQFNPATLLPSSQSNRSLLIFEPISATAVPHSVKFLGYNQLLENGVKVASLQSFEVSAPGTRSIIRTDMAGNFVMSEDSSGQTMKVFPLTDAELRRGLEIVRKANASIKLTR